MHTGDDYRDYQLRRFSKDSIRFALKVGGVLGIGMAAIFVLPIYSFMAIQGFVLLGLAAVLCLFSVWLVTMVTVEHTIEFVWLMTAEYKEAMNLN